MFALLAKAREMERSGSRIVHLEIGDPDFSSPDNVINAAKKALDGGLTHYVNSMGMMEFRQAIVEYITTNYGFTPDVNQVLVCPANAIIDFTVRCVANPGDEIIYPDPGFPTYHSVIVYNGMKPVGIQLKEENLFQMDPAAVRKNITDKTRLIIINSPQNPTGSVMSQDEILAIAKIAAEEDIYLLTDEVYSRLIYNAQHYSPSVVDCCRERTVILNSLSKVYSMSGWRLGYAVGPEKLIGKMGLLLQTIISCLPGFTQSAGITALSIDRGFVEQRVKVLKQRRDLLISGLNSLPGVSCLSPEGAFYAFANIKNTGMTSEEYSDKLLACAGVCVLPGNCFGRFGEGFIRLCYASLSFSAIEEALDKMKRFHAGIS
ncbi:MAG: pyridoxal phosphate-dependent aminotransferase [Candidatus Omnitrophica bacterium]|nr:pyridoxal phosphate-dependent aminotransferase [Candidatus Omnitrophota bacterium]